MSADLDARLTIAEYRLDKAEQATTELRKDYTEGHQELSKALRGIENNLKTIKLVAMGAALAFLAQAIGLEKAVTTILKLFL